MSTKRKINMSLWVVIAIAVITASVISWHATFGQFLAAVAFYGGACLALGLCIDVMIKETES